MRRLVAESERLIERMEDQTELSTTSQALRIRWLRMLNREGRIAEYIEESLAAKLTQAISDESQAEAHLIAAELYQALGDLDKSLEVSQQAYEIDRSRFQSLAVAKVRAGQVEEMVRMMAEIYEEVPEDRLRVASVLSSGLVSGRPTKVNWSRPMRFLSKRWTPIHATLGSGHPWQVYVFCKSGSRRGLPYWSRRCSGRRIPPSF